MAHLILRIISPSDRMHHQGTDRPVQEIESEKAAHHDSFDNPDQGSENSEREFHGRVLRRPTVRKFSRAQEVGQQEPGFRSRGGVRFNAVN
jgi:hypothetical protein